MFLKLENTVKYVEADSIDDLKLSKYSCDNYSTTEDPRTLEELGCDVMIRINGRWIIKNDLKHLSINEIYDLKEIKNGNKNN